MPRRLPEPWIYIPAAPIVYVETPGGRFADLLFDPIPQDTRNVAVGMFAMGTGPNAKWNNNLVSMRVEGREQVIGPGCALGLVASETRFTGAPTGAGATPEAPTIAGPPFWPGQTLQLYSGRLVGGFPIRGREQLRLRLVNTSGNPDDDITQLGLFMFELPNDNAADNRTELNERWETLYRGIDAIVFGTHIISYAGGGINNFDDPLVISVWSNVQQRRTELRTALLDEVPIAGGFVINESLLRDVLINTRTDRTRPLATQNVSAAMFTPPAGGHVSDLFPIDYKGAGDDRDTITVTAPPFPPGTTRELHCMTILSGIVERQYFGRVAGQPM